MNAVFAVDKPVGMSSNQFLTKLKKQYGFKKCGYSGTLDPFASGLLLVGVGAYTKLFPYLDKKSKTYEATLWLGCESESLDIEGVKRVENIPAYTFQQVLAVLEGMKGEISYTPPKFSAKHINGKRAYELAREGVEFELQQSTMQVFELELLHYMHPFVSFRVSVSEGGYIRSLGEVIAERLGCRGSLSSLRRIKEGSISVPSNEIEKLEISEVLKLEEIDLSNYKQEIENGKKLIIHSCKFQKHKPYLVNFEDFFSIIEFQEKGEIKYLLNRIPRC